MCKTENSSIKYKIYSFVQYSNTCQCLILLGIEGPYFTSISYFNLYCAGILKPLAAIANESSY